MDLNGMMDARNADVKMGWPPAIQWCAIRNGQTKFLCNNSMFEFSIFNELWRFWFEKRFPNLVVYNTFTLRKYDFEHIYFQKIVFLALTILKELPKFFSSLIPLIILWHTLVYMYQETNFGHLIQLFTLIREFWLLQVASCSRLLC